MGPIADKLYHFYHLLLIILTSFSSGLRLISVALLVIYSVASSSLFVDDNLALFIVGRSFVGIAVPSPLFSLLETSLATSHRSVHPSCCLWL